MVVYDEKQPSSPESLVHFSSNLKHIRDHTPVRRVSHGFNKLVMRLFSVRLQEQGHGLGPYSNEAECHKESSNRLLFATCTINANKHKSTPPPANCIHCLQRGKHLS